MPLVPFGELLGEAARGGYAVGYFEAWDSYSLEAVLAAAELERAPVVLGFGCLLLDQTWLADGGIEIFGALGRAAAARSQVPVSLLLNEAHTSNTHAWNRGRVQHRDAGDERCGARSRPSPGTPTSYGVAVEGELGSCPTATPRAKSTARRRA